MKFWREANGVLVRQAASTATRIRDGIKASVDVEAIIKAWNEAHPFGGQATPKQARDWARTNIEVNGKPLVKALNPVYSIGYVIGQQAALTSFAKAKLSKTPSVDDLSVALSLNWDTWKPGNKPASLLVTPPKGLRRLLDRSNVTIQGVNNTTLDRIGTQLGEALASGATDMTLANTIRGLLDDPSRALVIANTEMNRAMSVASVESYQAFGVEQVEWLVMEPCDICAENDGVTVDLMSEFPSGDTEPPAHPNCVCSIAPVIQDDTTAPTTPEDVTDLPDAVEEPTLPEMPLPEMPSIPDVIEPPVLPTTEPPAVKLPPFWVWDKKAFTEAYGRSPNYQQKFLELRAETLKIKLDDVGAKFKMLDKPEHFRAIAKNTNPMFDPTKPAYSTNCARVINAAEMRARGYDVTATAHPTGTFKHDGSQVREFYGSVWVDPKTGITAWDERIHFDKVANSIEIDQAILAKHTEGARGFISQNWQNYKGAGHVYSWKIVDNKVRYFDAQTGKILDREYFPEDFHLDKGENFDIVRVDNKEPTAAVLQYLKGWK